MIRQASALLLCLMASPFLAQAQSANLEDSLVVSQSDTLKDLEGKGFSVGDLLSRSGQTGVLNNLELSQTPTFKPILDNLKSELDTYQKNNPKAGVGLAHDARMFDSNYLLNERARFVLVGVINRMDHGYKYGDRCGEIRFIYRLAYNVIDHGSPVSSRLPITLNLVYNAGVDSNENSCALAAKSWSGVQANSTAQDLIATGPLNGQVFSRERLHALEVNLQISREAASARPDFGGEAAYLLKVYNWNGTAFVETPLENQIDRTRLLANPSLLAEMKAWIVKNIVQVDAGTALLPDKFLATTALSTSPGGIERSINRIYDGLFTPDELKGLPYDRLMNIKSPAGLVRRLNDTACVGCHQTRAIGGFHFTGIDPLGKYPGNSVFLPGSPHFMGDLARRRSVVESIANRDATIDFSRGFADRPQSSRSQSLQGSGLLNGWGAHCYKGTDASFASWTCASGLKCTTLLDTKDNFGVCLAPHLEVGGPCDVGVVKTISWGVDKYISTSDRYNAKAIPNSMCSPQSQEPGTLTGGFLNGNIRTLSCTDLPAEASCGPLPASRPGFNSCVGRKNFGDCLKEYAIGVGLRGCDQKNPCRDDYICGQSLEANRGSCVPPYFLFQFRVDGHPLSN